ncbi:MAG: polysaccharide biosynthesis/export family protein [Akkermansiaceae bacterium]|nr:polysaccharide biosynthesis/export family protein [Akkermansiaceae bacterium]MCP5544905.1 polysaccharide biosynthesis/export family protein [Akkermansiaceae bacterium]MCP5549010.1 polysaccharide biosynthesis/export family protein [Akkermansiaceae bacterium]
MNLRSLLLCLLAVCGFATPVLSQIQPGRAIQISISGVPPEETQRINQIYPVSESGMVNMPFIGKVNAAGLRAEQLASSLESRYKSAGIYRNPTFQVIDSSQKTIEEQVIVVGGQVQRPGPVPYTRTLTLYQAIQAGGGATPFGSMKRVKLFRGGKQKQYDLTKSQFMHIPLEPNDTIEVPQKTVLGN